MKSSRRPSNELTDFELLQEVDQFILDAKALIGEGVSASADIKGTQATRKVELKRKDLESA